MEREREREREREHNKKICGKISPFYECARMCYEVLVVYSFDIEFKRA